MTIDSSTQVAKSARSQGQRAIGHVGSDVPPELIVAANAKPIRLTGLVECATPMADRYIEPSFSPETRSIADRWLAGALDDFEAVIFSRSDDSAQRLYYYLCELQRMGRCKGPTALLFDIPKIRRGTSTQHAIASTQRLARELGTDPAKLEDAAQQLARSRHALAKLYERRLEATPPLGSALYELEQTLWGDATLPLTSPSSIEPTHRLMLIGSMPPDARLHRAVERAGATIVAEMHEPLSWTSVELKSPVSLESLATDYHAASIRQRECLRLPQQLIEVAQRMRVDAAIVWLIEEDTGLAWELPVIRRALAEASIPTLVLTRQRWTADSDTLEACTAFAAQPERSA